MTTPLPPKRRKPAREALPFDVLDLDGLHGDFAAGRVRQVGVVARRLLATLDAVLSSQGMVRASIESAHATALAAARAEAKGLRGERDRLAGMIERMGEIASEGRGEVCLGLTEDGDLGLWLPDDGYPNDPDSGKVPQGNTAEEAIRLRLERLDAALANGGA